MTRTDKLWMRTNEVSIPRVRQALTFTVILACLVGLATVVGAQDEIPAWRAQLIALSENGRYLAVRYGAELTGFSESVSEIWVYDLEDLLLPPHKLVRGPDVGSNLAFSPNNRYLAIGNHHKLSIFNLEDKKSILDLQRVSTEIPTDFTWATFNSDSSHIMAFSHLWASEHEMSIWGIGSAKRVHAVKAQPGRRWTYRNWLSPDWSQYVRWSDYSAEGTTVYEFDILQGLGQQLARLPGSMESAAFSPDGSLFALAIEGITGDRVTLQVYDTATWSLIRSIVTNSGVCDADVGWRFSHDNTYLAFIYTCFTTRLSVWNLKSEELVFSIETRPTDARFTRNNKFLIAAGISGISVWNIENKFEFSEYPGGVARLHPKNELMAAIGPDNRVWIWNIESKQLLVILPIPQI